MREHNKGKQLIADLFQSASITIDGKQPWDPQIHDERFFTYLLQQQSLGLGEAYVNGWFDVPQVDQFFHKILAARIDDQFYAFLKKNKRYFLFMLGTALQGWKMRLFNHQTIKRAFQVAEEHYDLGNDLFECMLGKSMTYTCAYWKDSKTLDEAQEAKLKLICEKLGLLPGQRLLDIGCGWGSLARYAAENYGVHVVGVTISKEQKEWVDQRSLGLPIEVRLMDYRQLNEPFDHVVSVGMFEHVGPKNYTTYMRVANRCLKNGGLFLLHTIGCHNVDHAVDPWLQKYIFPNGMLPTFKQLACSIEGSFVMEDWHNFGTDYDKTLMAWRENFQAHWPSLKERYGDRFYRMWNYYLSCCAGGFRARILQLWQVVLSKNGVPGGYRSIR